MRLPPALTASLVVLALLEPRVSAQEEASEREIKSALASPDSLVRNKTWKKLNPEVDSQYKYLVQILKSLPWYDREGAVMALAKAATEGTIKKMAKDLKENKDPAVRQGMADALAKMNDEKFYPNLYEALNDKNPFVRRMVVYSLRIHKKKEAVDALINRFQKEEDPVVKSFIVDTLNSLTKAYQGVSPIAWFTWWEQAKADKNYELGKTDEQAQKKAEELGNKLKKRVTVSAEGGVTLETEERGNTKLNSVPILVLPDYGYTKDIMLPFLSELEKTNKLFYINLPPVSAFKNLQTVSAKNIPYLPLDQLVAAFEDLRKQTGQQRFAIMACGINTWIAMRYSTLHPESISHMVLINPVSSLKEVGAGIDRMVATGKAKNDIELWHLGLSSRFHSDTGINLHEEYHSKEKIPVPEGEGASLDRRSWSLYFKDERDSLIGMLFPARRDPNGSNFAYPEFRCFNEKPRMRIPTVVITGKNCLFSSVDDCKAIAQHFGGQLYVYENSSAMPFAEESPLFNKHMAFLLREKAAKGKSKEKDSAEKDSSAKSKEATGVDAGKTVDPEKKKSAEKDPKKEEK